MPKRFVNVRIWKIASYGKNAMNNLCTLVLGQFDDVDDNMEVVAWSGLVL